METTKWSWEQHVPKKVRRVIQETLEDIVPTVYISPGQAEDIRKGVIHYVETVVIVYSGPSSNASAGYIAKELVERVEGERDQYVLAEVKGLADVLSQL